MYLGKKKCCDNNCKTTEEFLANHMLPIGIIGEAPEEIQIAHFKLMQELYEKYGDKNAV